MASPTAKLTLYIAARKMNAIRIKLPKPESNKVTKSPGTANMTTHKKINRLINPTTKLRFLEENIFPSEKDIFLYILQKEILNTNHLKRTRLTIIEI